ncbi:autotransporter domain-containing protein [Rhizobium halophytocola]|uniref:HAF family extracellular repeat protein n=1 Tax=Rhizobium halophytocola TaxID=735519 RepID=A0ABS4E1U5_9HYPH|nr:autotransporter domain-containing protein [Rhizobium halophytocola]MBP1851924.1 putative HAF family extracellular repeat protein [Rhizobium halophytocola]
MEDLGSLSGGDSFAFGTNIDGSVVVGDAGTEDRHFHAFRWTEATGMEDLGTLAQNGGHSAARAVNSDGTTVVGFSETSDGFTHAFRWTASGMEDLQALGGNYSYAYGVSADGSVVVGQAATAGDSVNHAFRWTSATNMIDLGTLAGSEAYSSAYGVSSDGGTVVGESETGQGHLHAFRWTAATGMADLGTLGGSLSYAEGVNANGNVIVGSSSQQNGESRAFRWTNATGMISVEDWLRANGVTVDVDFSQTAKGVSADGKVIVGETQNQTAYIARVMDDISGVIDVDEYTRTLAAKPNVQPSLDYADITMNGAQGEPMRNLLAAGQQSFSITADGGRTKSDSLEGGFGIADISYAIGLEGGATARLSAGGLYARQDIATGGDMMLKGFHVAPEVSLPVLGDVYATFGGYYSRAGLDVKRGYLNAGSADSSHGDTDVETWGAKLRVDWHDVFALDDWSFTPYASLTYAHASMDAYTETGGSFPASFAGVHDHETVARLGLDAVGNVTERFRLTAKLEADYRFEDRTASTGGQILGLSAFALPGQEIDQFSLRAGIGAELDTAGGTAFISLNASGLRDDPSVWVRSGWKIAF